ncbi:MAG: TonB-dependent receptor [Planctomycetes bacterium]|nr:TonB-dependent receptor [Planctomycetota bacterium]
MTRVPFHWSPILLAAGLLAQQPATQAPVPVESSLDLTELSLEQLMAVPVEVGARHQESLASTAASVYVLSEPEIRRSGMRSVPDLLRLVPGLIIAQDVPGAFGFSSRLGEHSFAGMLVLLDGERLYTTLLRREYWQAIDLPIENIERIEVVRGPGGARWGDKASQGVVNIVTKKAADAQGLRATASFGTDERGMASLRYGASVGDATQFYVYGKLAERDGGYPTVAGDRWGADRAGLRVDSALAPDLRLAVDGEYHDSFLGDSYEIDPGFSSLNDIRGGHVKGRLRWEHEGGGSTEFRAAYDSYDQDIRNFWMNAFDEHLIFREDLVSATVQHTAQLGEGHRLTLGTGIRQLTVEWLYVAAADGAEYNETRGDAFVAWDWDLGADLRLTLGGNVGYLDGRYTTGVDVQPDVRLAWTPSPEFTLWGGVSANEEPDRRVPDSGLLVRRKASNLAACELGMRRRWGDWFLLQADTFVYDVTDQENGDYVEPVSGATLYTNGGETRAYGGELAATWTPDRDWRVSAFVATTQANAQDFAPDAFTIEVEVPRTRAGLTVGWEPLPGLQIDSHVLYTEQRYDVPTWWRVDLRVGYRCSERTQFELVGHNLTDPHHPEYWYEEQAERGVYFLVSHQF